jgi:hypothetical protein
MFPDQNSWIRKLQNHKKGKGCTLKGFLDLIGLGGEAVELATMWMCLLMDEGLDEENKFYTEHQEALWKECAEHRRCHGFWPHPFVATKRFLSALLPDGDVRTPKGDVPTPEGDVQTFAPQGWPQRRLLRKTAVPPEAVASPESAAAVRDDGPEQVEKAPVTPVPGRCLERRESEVPTLPVDSPPEAESADDQS